MDMFVYSERKEQNKENYCDWNQPSC